eukprot:15169343-Alexandrium_andersonii.AAC.1
MSASLVGSEMCIRDSCAAFRVDSESEEERGCSGGSERGFREGVPRGVSERGRIPAAAQQRLAS